MPSRQNPPLLCRFCGSPSIYLIIISTWTDPGEKQTGSDGCRIERSIQLNSTTSENWDQQSVRLPPLYSKYALHYKNYPLVGFFLKWRLHKKLTSTNSMLVMDSWTFTPVSAHLLILLSIHVPNHLMIRGNLFSLPVPACHTPILSRSAYSLLIFFNRVASPFTFFRVLRSIFWFCILDPSHLIIITPMLWSPINHTWHYSSKQHIGSSSSRGHPVTRDWIPQLATEEIV